MAQILLIGLSLTIKQTVRHDPLFYAWHFSKRGALAAHHVNRQGDNKGRGDLTPRLYLNFTPLLKVTVFAPDLSIIFTIADWIASPSRISLSVANF
ncbi:MAG: hypothetical protein QNK31_12100 [Porticoccus sp.]|nr:hypothetical protein [Porticoccus sp.]